MAEQTQHTNQTKSELVEWLKAILIAGVLVFVIRWFIFAPYVVDGPSMQPNFHTGDRLIVDKIVYELRHPRRGEVIVFLAPEGKDYIKRVIGLPGDKVKVQGDNVYINGSVIKEPYIQDVEEAKHKQGALYNDQKDFPETTVPEGELFVMGDNRPDSLDSRYAAVGFVPYSKVIGRADLRFWPLGSLQFIRHPKVSP